jgi:hypothetical protein
VPWQGRTEAAATEAEVEEWWRRWPGANLGVVTGRVSGVVVFDVDPRHGGNAALNAFEARWGLLPLTLEAHTGGGGRHLWFSSGQALPSVVLAPGLELKAERAVVVVPPSVHASGRPYVWRDGRGPEDVRPAPLPDWVEALAQGDARAELRHPLADPPVRTTLERVAFAEAWARAGIDLVPGDRYYLCPFHDDHHPSLHIDSEACRWFCFGCRRGGGTGRLRRLLGDLPSPVLRARLRGHAGRERPVAVAGSEEFEVVGESEHQDALLALAGGSRSYGGVELDAVAELVHDSDDSLDFVVLIDGLPVGRLRREDAARVSPTIDEVLDCGGPATCRARIRGGWDRGGADVGRFGVVVLLPR